MVDCACGGQRTSRSWHRVRGLPSCDAVRKQRAKEERERVSRHAKVAKPPKPGSRPPWIEGSSILVPEIDPL